jgi:molybdate transport system regulatory protein
MRSSSTVSLPSLSIRIDLDAVSHRARQNPVTRVYSYLRFDLGRMPRHGHVLSAGVAAGARDQSYLQARCRRAASRRQKRGRRDPLAPFGLSLVARYRKIERSAETVAREDFLSLRADLGARTEA